jgi:hypothetical protein
MNHQKVYDNIIEKARSKNRCRSDKIYYEDHHIIPHCLDGSDEQYNRVLLTAREHFVCHKLLTYIYPQNFKIIHAFHLMTCMNKRKYSVTSRDYAYAMELFRSIPIDHNGKNNPMYGKTQSKKSIEKNIKSQPYTSQNFPQWLKDKIGEKSKGKNNAMFGKTFHDIWVINFGKEIADKKLEEYKNNLKGKLWMRSLVLNKSKQIKPNEITHYLQIGWEFGRQPQKKRKLKTKK